VASQHHPVAVILDFVNPVGSSGDFVSFGGERELVQHYADYLVLASVIFGRSAVCTALGRAHEDKETIANLLHPIIHARDTAAAKLIQPLWLQVAARMAIHRLSGDDAPQDA
jgi:hypothetical protein